MPYIITQATEAHLSALAEIELLAARLFAGYDLPQTILQETTPLEELRAAMHDGYLWVAVAAERPVGFARAELLNHDPTEIRTGAGPVTCGTPPLARRGPRLRRHPLLVKNFGFHLGQGLGTALHLEELDVHPAHGRRGLGRALVETVCACARAQGREAVTLTTFRDVPWNAPFYQGLGFHCIPAAALSPELQRRVDEESARGLPAHRRVVMIKQV